MASSKTHRLSASLTSLGRPLRPRERERLRAFLRRALAWQRDLQGFPAPLVHAPDGTPYVSIYKDGELRGCYGSHEGGPGERLARALLLSLADRRYGGIAPTDRASLRAEVAYVTSARPVRADEAEASLEPGVQGVALVTGDAATLVLPSVARDHGHDAKTTLDLLANKARRERSLRDEGLVWLLDVEAVSTHGVAARDPRLAARRWLESLVSPRGALSFELVGATGARVASGTMRHGRIAVAVEALAALRSRKARAARDWLAREIALGLRDASEVVGWPQRPDMVLGTLALATRAGLDVPLAELAASADPSTVAPWHAAQVAAVLGERTPAALYRLCVADLEGRPFSPYLAMAARRRGDGRVLERTARALVATLSPAAPFAGGARVTPVPEVALTAVAVEALAPLSTSEARRAVARGRAFLAGLQVLDVPGAMHPSALGAFRASPIAPILRCDITAHAALACFVSD
ncbi:MAG TPA: AMMECR1 domain-containing protein [Polyangiaceae bacterium]|nr:AMMECR1 domain-containing protein [Polyangiaceae bacterium]